MKKLTVFTIAAIILLGGCAKTNPTPDNYAEILRAAVYAGQPRPDGGEPEPAPAAEVVSGPMIFTQPVPATAAPTQPATHPPETAAPEPVYAPEPETEAPHEPYVITPSGKKYHYPSCRTVKTIKQYLSKAEAEQLGFGPCGICKPE